MRQEQRRGRARRRPEAAPAVGAAAQRQPLPPVGRHRYGRPSALKQPARKCAPFAVLPNAYAGADAGCSHPGASCSHWRRTIHA